MSDHPYVSHIVSLYCIYQRISSPQPLAAASLEEVASLAAATRHLLVRAAEYTTQSLPAAMLRLPWSCTAASRSAAWWSAARDVDGWMDGGAEELGIRH